MTDKKQRGPGRPSDGDYPQKVFARISEEQHQFLLDNYDTISDGIRAAIRCLIERDMGD